MTDLNDNSPTTLANYLRQKRTEAIKNDVHPTHIMADYTQGPGARCLNCDRCTCHRPNGLLFQCPATEFDNKENK